MDNQFFNYIVHASVYAIWSFAQDVNRMLTADETEQVEAFMAFADENE